MYASATPCTVCRHCGVDDRGIYCGHAGAAPQGVIETRQDPALCGPFGGWFERAPYCSLKTDAPRPSAS